MTETLDNRKAFASTLIELAREDDRIVVVCNDSVGSSNMGGFREEFPDRLVNVGIAEQNMVGVAAGLAGCGFIPFVCAAAPFLTGRATEQIKADVAYSGHAVVLCGMSPGMAYGPLGPTHHSIEDLSWMRAIADLDVAVPADSVQTSQAVRALVAEPRGTYLRIGRFPVPNVTDPDQAWERGRITTLREGSDVALVAIGTLVSRALEAADLLEKDGISATVLNAAWVSPLDAETIRRVATDVPLMMVLEEANTSGGLSAAVSSEVAQMGVTTRVIPVGVDEFAPTGSAGFLLDHFGLNADSIAARVKDLL